MVDGNPFWLSDAARISTVKSSYPIVLEADQLNWALNLLVKPLALGRTLHSAWGAPALVFKSAGADLQNIRTYDPDDMPIVKSTYVCDAAEKLANPKYLIPYGPEPHAAGILDTLCATKVT